MEKDKESGLERIHFICECSSLEHQVHFWYDEELDMFYCEPFLKTHKNFLQRVLGGIRYIFGYKSRYGDFDSTIFKPGDLNILRDFLNEKQKLDKEIKE